MTGTLQGKTIIVTGAGGGIGRAASLVLADAGANVVVTDIAKEAGGATVDAVRSAGGTAVFVQADLGTENEVRAIVERALQPTVGWTAPSTTPVWSNARYRCTSSRRAMERALRVDLTSVFWCIKYQVLQ